MKVYKDRHLTYTFDISSKYVFKKGPRAGELYNGPIIAYRGKKFAGEKMSADIERKWELMRRGPAGEGMEKEVTARVLVYDKLKIKYAKKFKFPKSYTHFLSEKEIKAGKYSRYFITYKEETTEISKSDHKYYKKNSTAYHKGVDIAEVKMQLDIMATDINQASINAVANLGMPKILQIMSAHDYMETQEFLYSPGGQLEYEDGAEFIGQ